MKTVFLLGAGFALSTPVFAQSAADALLGNVNTSPVNTSEAGTESLHLSDPFLNQLFVLWRMEQDLPFDVNTWMQLTLSQKNEQAAHLWSAISSKIPSSFEHTARAAHLYNLWKLKLSQTFFSEWTKAIGNPEFRTSKASSALNGFIRTSFDRWIAEEAVIITPELEPILRALPPHEDSLYATVQAYFFLRKGEDAGKVLSLLPINHYFLPALAQTVALSYAKKNDLSKAAMVLKNYYEPAIKSKKDPALLASYYLELARLLYQAGSLDGAELFYEKIPNSVPEYIQAREELTWVWLRKGETQKLRGNIATLKSPLFEHQFAPETFVVQSISNLKFCFYDEVEKDFKSFQKVYLPWARKIQDAMKASDPVKPEVGDWFSKQAEFSVEKRTAEVNELELLTQRSVSAVLPAVGPQSHWVRYKNENLAGIETAKKMKASEYRRQWKNKLLSLNEAIRKMHFVKVEYLSQIRTFAQQGIGESSVLSVSALKKEPEQIVFPFDGVVWPDEFFKIRALAQGRCLKGSS